MASISQFNYASILRDALLVTPCSCRIFALDSSNLCSTSKSIGVIKYSWFESWWLYWSSLCMISTGTSSGGIDDTSSRLTDSLHAMGQSSTITSNFASDNLYGVGSHYLSGSQCDFTWMECGTIANQTILGYFPTTSSDNHGTFTVDSWSTSQ